MYKVCHLKFSQSHTLVTLFADIHRLRSSLFTNAYSLSLFLWKFSEVFTKITISIQNNVLISTLYAFINRLCQWELYLKMFIRSSIFSLF